MPIVKQKSSQRLIRDAIVLDLGDLGRQAARLRAAAEARAHQILADARAEAERLIAGAEQTGLEKGHAEGLAQGLEAGRAQGHAAALASVSEQVKQLTERFNAVAEQWDTSRVQLDREARTEVLDFAVKFARKVTHRVIEVDPGVIVDQVASALSRVLEPTDVTIRVAPDDRETLQEVLPDLLAGLSHLQHVQLVDDPAVGRGGCVLALRGGEIDATIDTQMRRLAEVILPAGGRPETPTEESPAAESPQDSGSAHTANDANTHPDAGAGPAAAPETAPETDSETASETDPEAAPPRPD